MSKDPKFIQKIPERFLEECGESLGAYARVRSREPGEVRRDIQWRYIRGERYFGHGWRKYFAEPYGLDNGYCVHFKYRGASKFDVVIYDAEGCEAERLDGCVEDTDPSDAESAA